MTDSSETRGGRKPPSDEELARAVPGGEAGREARIGLFVLLGLISFVVVLFLLTDPSTFRGRYNVVTAVEDAGGVRNGDPIQMRGVNIGRVAGFHMREDGQVDITLEIEGEWGIPVDSRTQLGSSGIFGGRAVEVIRGISADDLSEGDRLTDLGSTSDALEAVAGLSDQAGTVMERIEALLSERTVQSVEAGAGELAELLAEMSAVTKEQRGTLKSLTESLARSAEGLEDAAAAGPDVANAIAQADSAMTVLTQTSRSLDAAATSLRSMLARIERGEGTLGRLAHDESLYDNLNRAAESVASLTADLQANPGKYINVSIF